MLSLLLTAFVVTSSGPAVSNHSIRADYAHRQIAEDGIDRTAPRPEIVVPAPRPAESMVSALGSIMVDYTPEGTVWLPEIVVTAPRPSKAQNNDSKFSRVDLGPDGTYWLGEVVITAKRLTPSVPSRTSTGNVLPLVISGALVLLSTALVIALLPGLGLSIRPKRLAPVHIRIAKKA
jgi:hypothetical protein